MFKGSEIIGTGRYLGEISLSPDDVLRNLNLKREELTLPSDITLVNEAYPVRLRTDKPETASTSTYLVEAGRRALENAGVAPGEIDLLICVTDMPDYVTPATSARIQYEMGLANAGFFDLNSGCAGFSIALTMANNFLRCSDDARHVLIVGGNLYTRYVNPSDLYGQLLFSDGGGAIVLRGTDNPEVGFQKSTFSGKGENWDRWGVYAGGTWKGLKPEILAEGYQYLKMIGAYDKDMNIKNWPPIIQKTLDKTGWKPTDLDHAFLTQSRPKPIAQMAALFGWDPQISYNTAPKFGYLGSACIPAALDDAAEMGALEAGDKLLILSSGIGYSVSSATVVWGANVNRGGGNGAR